MIGPMSSLIVAARPLELRKYVSVVRFKTWATSMVFIAVEKKNSSNHINKILALLLPAVENFLPGEDHPSVYVS